MTPTTTIVSQPSERRELQDGDHLKAFSTKVAT